MGIPFERVVVEHGATVLRVCQATLGSGPDAEDAWSETFLSALKAWPTLQHDPPQNLQAWLVRVAQRRCIDLLRAAGRRPVPTAELPEQHRSEQTTHPAADGLWEAVHALPEQQRLAVAGHYLGGLSHAETAALIGSSPTAVRKAASDGIKQLRRSHLDTQKGGDPR